MGMDTTRSLALTSSRESNHVPAAQRIFLEILNRKVQGASLAFRVAGSTFVVGNGTEPSRATVLVHNPRFFSRVVAHGNLGLGESYMYREFDVEGGKLDEFLRTLLVNRVDREISLSPGAALRVLWMRVADTLRGKENNIHRHYDTGIDLFTAFLGTNLVYSCGYVNEVTDSLDQLQINKMDRICRKLRLQSGERLLDIGCGYGGLLIHAAKNYGVLGTGVTNSRDHAACGNERIAEHGLNGRADIHYADFTTLQGTYDKVVSVGMMEHVPRREYKQYFRKLARLLSPQG